MGEIVMEDVYTLAIIIWLIFFCWFTYKCCVPRYAKPGDRTPEERKQDEEEKRRDIAQVKAQDKYDNDWGYIR